MLHRLIDRNEDMRRLVNDGYALSLSRSKNHLLVAHVPYVTAQRAVAYGTLVAELNLSGDLLNAPQNHVVTFIGEMPCDVNGKTLDWLYNPSAPSEVDVGLRVDRTFSASPPKPYTNYYDKVTTYVEMLAAHAREVDSEATAKTHPPLPLTEEESVFKYADTASSRAGITAISAKVAAERVAIVGVGGTGSYLLDFIAKVPIKEIHLFDEDVFSSHNAFRSPGAASIEELEQRPSKVAYHASVYGKLRRGIVVHDYPVSTDNVQELTSMDFVFLCMDGGDAKKAIVQELVARGTPFIDVGVGIQLVDDKLTGVVRTTTSTRDKSDHVLDATLFGGGGVNEYDRNVQVVELNALNAALAVIKWKKLCGFYADEGREHSTHYSISQNAVLNEHAA
jgi:ThiF family